MLAKHEEGAVLQDLAVPRPRKGLKARLRPEAAAGWRPDSEGEGTR